MDALSEVLRAVRLTGATFFSAEFSAPWGFMSPPIDLLAASLPSGTEHVILYHLVTEGSATAQLHDGGEVSLGPGDVVVVPHGDAHRVWNGPSPAWRDTRPDIERALAGTLEVSRGGGGGAFTRFVCGYFSCERQAARLFLGGLPPLLKIGLRDGANTEWLEAAIRFLVTDAASGRPGRLALLAKLSEALFIETLRRYMATLPVAETGWLAGARDPLTGHALALLHRYPARRWTADMLAKEAATSRTVLMERFHRFLGEPPMAYLSRWRLRLATRLLETTDQAIGEIAAAVGYESEASFNRAFKRESGSPPGRYRSAHRDKPPAGRP